MYKIIEIFESKQGEGYNVGKKVIFIRLALCNLECAWCDTDFESNIKHMSVKSIIEELANYKTKNIILTGGEPTFQNLDELLNALKDKGYWIAIETNGTNDFLDERIDYVATSPKRGQYTNIKNANEVRLVFDTDNIEEMEKFCIETREQVKASRYYLSPVEIEKEFQNLDKLITLRQILLEKEQEWQISIQIHKMLDIK